MEANMDEVIPGLWIGDLQSALNVKLLKERGIFSVLSAMRGRITVHETFIRHQIMLDDTEDADVLTHLLPAIHFIEAELGKGRGVLVHCQAGISRSSTIVAAYLMYSKKINPEAALDMIRKVRPSVEPNQGFLRQLELFHASRYQISRREKAIRMFYMGRAVEEVMNGDGSLPETEMFAKYPRTPSDSLPNTPGGPRRRIRCKMQELATREHMLDHGQLGPATPATTTPAASRRPSLNAGQAGSGAVSRSSSGSDIAQRTSRLSFSTSVLGDSLSLTSIKELPTPGTERSEFISEEPNPPPSVPIIPPTHPLHSLRSMSQQLLDKSAMSTSALEDEDENVPDLKGKDDKPPSKMKLDLTGATPQDLSIQASRLIGARLSDSVLSTPADARQNSSNETNGTAYFAAVGNAVNEVTANAETTVEPTPTTRLISSQDLAAQLFANPKIAALRSPPLTTSVPSTPNLPSPKPLGNMNSPPIILNPKCSGYFVEPMKWMEFFLSEGQIAGKIICPNKKCGAKLGNYDWAGVCCGCKEWVTPGFCINRSKVDEVV
ncbi:hypothetical protein CPC08DRAFT_763500 [Agrocybe pediades]|nr:hypothetical protein CPC08DRAFT_763500 [Agrocybe pediades]